MLGDDDDDEVYETHPAKADLLDELVGDSDDQGNKTDGGVVVTETVKKS